MPNFQGKRMDTMITSPAMLIATSAMLKTGNHQKSMKSLTHHNIILSYILAIAPPDSKANIHRDNSFL